MRYRRNIDCLGEDALHDLREALAAMYAAPADAPDGFRRVAGLHGGPPTAYCRHGSPGFFTWHRAYMLAFENALRAHRCDVVLPFWDWSSGPSTGVPGACREATYVNRAGDTVPNPLYRGPDASGGQTSRRADIDTTAFDDLATSAQAAMSASSFSSFQNQINGVHGSVHVRVGGDMGSVPTAGFDPIFYLHHANVDRLWAGWQASHPGSLPASEATFELEPFNRPFSAQWQTGADVESTESLGYRYRRFCLLLPPFRIWELVAVEWPWDIRERMTSARLVIRASRMQERSMELRAFLGQPKATGRSEMIGNPAFAGAVGFFGHPSHGASGGGHGKDRGGGHGAPSRAAGVTERFDLEIDLTATARALDRESAEVALKLVAVDETGAEVAAEDARIEGVELVVE